MANSALRQKYLDLIRRLFPRGYAWDRVTDSSSTFSKLLKAMATELCNIDERSRELIEEVDPRTTNELLTDWERLLGLPDECDNSEDNTLAQRRSRILQLLTIRGGQNESFYQQLASNFGFDVDVISAEDQPPFVAGSKAGTRLTNGDWKYAFIINTPADSLIRFRAGQSAAGDRLVTVGNSTIECLMEKYKPAHTVVLFNFGTGDF